MILSAIAEAISQVKDEQLSQRFRDIFLPDDQALHPGSFMRMPGLAGVIEAVLLNFHEGNFSQEMVDEVKDIDTLNEVGFIRLYGRICFSSVFSSRNQSIVINVTVFLLFFFFFIISFL